MKEETATATLPSPASARTGTGPRLSPGRRTGITVVNVLILTILVTWLVPAPVPVVDLVTGSPLAGASLTPVDPFLRDALEPLYGPLHLVSRLPDRRLLSLIVWTMLVWFGARVLHRARKGELRRHLGGEIRFLFGLYTPLALFPLPFLWIGVIPRTWQKALTPVGLPFLVLALLLMRALRRPANRGRRGRAALHLGIEFLGIPGFLAIGIFAMIFVIPGTWRTGLRLVPPPGKVVMDLHAHSQTSQDAIVGGVRRLDIFRSQGVTVSAVTEHNTYFDRREPEEPTFRTLRGPAKARGIEVLPGEEFTTHAVHLVLLGIHHTFNPSLYRTNGEKDRPPDYGYDYPKMIARVHREGGFVVVAHWGTIRQYDRIDWHRLISWGVDGFEIATNAERATPEQLAAWKKTGLLLDAGTDFHGWRRSIYCWNLTDAKEVSPDPWKTVRNLFRDRDLEVAVAGTFDPRVPAWLDPPVSVFRYFTGMRSGGRLSWLVLLLLIRVFVPARRRSESSDGEGLEPAPGSVGGGGLTAGPAPVVQ